MPYYNTAVAQLQMTIIEKKVFVHWKGLVMETKKEERVNNKVWSSSIYWMIFVNGSPSWKLGWKWTWNKRLNLTIWLALSLKRYLLKRELGWVLSYRVPIFTPREWWCTPAITEAIFSDIKMWRARQTQLSSRKKWGGRRLRLEGESYDEMYVCMPIAQMIRWYKIVRMQFSVVFFLI